MEQKPKIHPALAALIVIALVGIVTSVVIVVSNNKKDTSNGVDLSGFTTHSHDHEHVTDQPVIDSTDTSTYKDGTYEATGTYLSPGGRETVDLTVVIKDGVITDTSLTTKASTLEAQEHQELFSDHYKALIVGKKINGLSLSRVAGSSLTSNGFNDALDEIREDARA